MREKRRAHLPPVREFCGDFRNGTMFVGLGTCRHGVPNIVFTEDPEEEEERRVHFEVIMHEEENGWSREPDDLPDTHTLIGSMNWEEGGLHPKLAKDWARRRRTIYLYSTAVEPVPEEDEIVEVIKKILNVLGRSQGMGLIVMDDSTSQVDIDIHEEEEDEA